MRIHAQSRPQKGFTLVELLAVVAIILILLALLAPLLGQFRERGRTSVCQNNMRQFGTAYLTFAADHDGFLTATISAGSYMGKEEWQKGWIGKEALPPGMAAPRDWYKNYGVLKDYLSTETLKNRIFRCPSMPLGVLGSGVGSNGIHDYTMFAAFSGAKVSLLPTQAQVKRPDGKILSVSAPLFTEEEPAYGINDGFIDPDHLSVNRDGSWHLGYSCNYFATDGSTRNIQWGTSPGPQVFAWSAKAPSGATVRLGDLPGWQVWHEK